jgi:hypothetical protein
MTHKNKANGNDYQLMYSGSGKKKTLKLSNDENDNA